MVAIWMIIKSFKFAEDELGSLCKNRYIVLHRMEMSKTCGMVRHRSILHIQSIVPVPYIIRWLELGSMEDRYSFDYHLQNGDRVLRNHYITEFKGPSRDWIRNRKISRS